MNWAVIMAGGQGTRFWPLSTLERPKQLLPIASGKTMLEETVGRLRGFIPFERTLIVTNAVQAGEVRRLLPKLPPRNIVAEPCGRNTAPCIGLAAHIALKRDPNALLIVLPADQVITRRKVFLGVLRRAASLAAGPGVHVTLGIKPAFPATGYGYIEAGAATGRATYRVKRFVEKPVYPKAKEMFGRDSFSWNSGMFIWRADTFLASLDRYLPTMARRLAAIGKSAGTARFAGALKRHFPKLPAISVDYGVMEHTPNALVIKCDIGWSDVGSWDTASRYWDKDKGGNAVRAPFVSVGAEKNIVLSESGQLIACVGVKDLTVIATRENILVARTSDLQNVRGVPALIKKSRPKRRRQPGIRFQ